MTITQGNNHVQEIRRKAMSTMRLTNEGLVFDFTHDEVSKIMAAQDVTEQALATIGAAVALGGGAVGAVAALVAAAAATNLAIHKNQFQQADKGFGVEMTLPLWAIILQLWEVQLMQPLPAPPVGQGLQSTRGSVWHTVQPNPSSAFGSWSRLGDAAGAGQIAVGSNADGRLEVFAVDTADRLAWHIAQTAPNGSFGGWSRLFDAAGLTAGPGQITVGSNADGRLEVFTLDTAGHVWHTAQTAPNGDFGGWSQLGGAVGVGQITVISTSSGSLEVFAVDTAAGMAWTIFQDGPNGAFEGWVAVGDQLGLGHIAVGKNADDRLEVCAVQL